MLDKMITKNQNINFKPENLCMVTCKGVVINLICSQAFLLEDNMSRFRRLCCCGCGSYANQGKRFIHGHNWNGKKRPEHSKKMLLFGENHWAKSQEFIDNMTGENNPMKRKEVKDKHLKKMRSKEVHEKKSKAARALGDKHPSKRPEVAKKISESKKGKKRPDMTGENHWMKNPEIAQKITGKNNGFYGRTHTEEVKKLISKLKKGKKNPKQSEYMKNGGSHHSLSFRCHPSKPQKQLFKKIQKIYPESKIEYTSLKYKIDIAIPDLMIAIEYDGSYWHQDKDYDKRRQRKLEAIGWTFLRYVDYVPKMGELKKDLKELR